jgi:hypothetical protein
MGCKNSKQIFNSVGPLITPNHNQVATSHVQTCERVKITCGAAGAYGCLVKSNSKQLRTETLRKQLQNFDISLIDSITILKDGRLWEPASNNNKIIDTIAVGQDILLMKYTDEENIKKIMQELAKKDGFKIWHSAPDITSFKADMYKLMLANLFEDFCKEARSVFTLQQIYADHSLDLEDMLTASPIQTMFKNELVSSSYVWITSKGGSLAITKRDPYDNKVTITTKDVFIACQAICDHDLDINPEKPLRFTLDQFKSLKDMMTLCLTALHNSGCIHGDIKHANVIACGDKFKLIDFGFFTNVTKLKELKSYGTEFYMHPIYRPAHYRIITLRDKEVHAMLARIKVLLPNAFDKYNEKISVLFKAGTSLETFHNLHLDHQHYKVDEFATALVFIELLSYIHKPADEQQYEFLLEFIASLLDPETLTFRRSATVVKAGGAKMKKTLKKKLVQGRLRTVYTGKYGRHYVRIKGMYVSARELLISRTLVS